MNNSYLNSFVFITAMKHMLISFFEEFPGKENLHKLKLVAWPTNLYLAAKSLTEFEGIKTEIKKQDKSKRIKDVKKIKEFVYWPVLKKKEGYWLSPFSRRKALLRVFNELKGSKTSVMLDLELPTTQNPFLFITQLPSFFRNKSLIRQFIADYPGKVYLAEYYPVAESREKMLKFMGLHYGEKSNNVQSNKVRSSKVWSNKVRLNKIQSNKVQLSKVRSNKVKIIKMLYHSLLPFGDAFFRREIALGRKRHQQNYLAGLGVLSTGILDCEPTLSPQQLKNDLLTAQKEGVGEVVIYRLGGLNKEYARMIKETIKLFS
ncbi:MAG: hypothetical protein AB1668_01740 [Nanoarchaeota archaeon]